MDTIKLLSDQDLKSKLKEHNINVGPVTDSTRSLFQRKLYTLENETVQEVDDVKPVKIEEDKPVVREVIQPSGPIVYYAVQIPIEAKAEETTDKCVLTDKKEALQLLKKYPGSRFKIFNNRENAEKYASQPIDLIPQSPIPDLPSKNISQPVSEGSTFRGPKPPQLVQFRRYLEQGNIEMVKKTIWENPRFLISSGDTPVILQESFRYNALHVCANKNQATSAEAILELLQEEGIFILMYPDDSARTRKGRMKFLIDLYLNMPDKGVNETPLHFACKFGHLDTVKVLINHKATDKARTNKYGEKPGDIVCNRIRQGNMSTVKAEILSVLQGLCFVPLVRAVDDSVPPHVIDPLPPGQVNKELHHEMIGSPKDAPLVIRAMAGPMSPVQAERFRKTWTTPPSPSIKDKMMYASIRRGDPTKGLERIGRQLAHSLHIPWNEYWEFLDAYIDLSSPEGLKLLEDFLRDRSEELCKELAMTSQIDSLGPLLDRLDLSTCFSNINVDDSNLSTPKRSVYPRDNKPDTVVSTPHQPAVISNNPFMPKSLLSTSAFNDSTVQTNKSVSSQNISSIVSHNTKQFTGHKGEGYVNTDENKGKSSVNADTSDSVHNDSVDDLLSAALSGLTLTSPKNDTVAKDNDDKPNNDNVFKGTGACYVSGSKTDPLVSSSKGNGDNNLSSKHSGTPVKDDPVTSNLTDYINNHINKPIDNCGDKQVSKSDFTDSSLSFEDAKIPAVSDSESDDEDDCASNYTTATDSSDPDDDIFEDSFGSIDGISETVDTPERLYLFGQEPTKTDVDVLRAIENVRISPVTHPHVFKWRNTVTCNSERSRTRWTATPSKRRLSQSTPRRHHNLSLMSASSRSVGSPLLFSPLEEDGPLSFTASDSSMSDSSFSMDESVNRIRANLIPDFLSASNA